MTLAEFKDYSRQFVWEYGDNERAELAILDELLEPYRSQD